MPVQPTAKELERRALKINPGGWAVESHQPLSTLLGSCVAVCLFDPVLKIGGMNHFLLPSRVHSRNADTDIILAGDYAMEVLVNALLGKGAQKHRLVAKAFGGGSVVHTIRTAIGARNAEFAQEWLAREGIPVAASDLLGPWSRKVVFAPDKGDAYSRRLPVTLTAVVAAVAEAEDAYEQTLAAPDEAKRTELF